MSNRTYAQEDATQLLGLRPGQKYDPDARTVIDALASRCAARKVAVRDLFHQLVYSYMIGNNDLHAKNLSIRQDPASGLWSVSPIYDVLHTWPYEGDHRFSPAVRPEGPRDAVSRKWWLELAADLGLPAKAAQRVIQQVTRASESVISRAVANDGLPTALHRDVRRVIAKRARDLSGETG
jgi:serine/threonine-protein kinase HipA